MNLLAIDTSGPVAGVCLMKDGLVIYEAAAITGHTHSENILPMVEEGLNRCGLVPAGIDLYAAVTGPGSYTGVRIGVSLVKGMAHGAGKPCIGVDALEALAAGSMATDRLICTLQDARAGQVYGAAFLGGLPPVRILPDEAVDLKTYLEKTRAVAEGRKLLFTGDGVKSFRKPIEEAFGGEAEFAPVSLNWLKPSAVAALAWARREEAVDYLTLMPVYLRAPQAERERARKLGLQA